MQDTKGRILIADDDETSLELTAEVLRAEGYACTSVFDANEAVTELRRQRYDLLISDLKMPGNDRLQMVDCLRHSTAALPVILMTAYPSVESAQRAVGLRLAAYLIKPFRIDVLVWHVSQTLDPRRLLSGRTVSEMRNRR